MATSDQIRARIIECVHNSELNMSDVLKTIKWLSDYAGLKTGSNMAKQLNISPAAICQSKREFVEIADVKFYTNYD
jgi:hypothetical protein